MLLLLVIAVCLLRFASPDKTRFWFWVGGSCVIKSEIILTTDCFFSFLSVVVCSLLYTDTNTHTPAHAHAHSGRFIVLTQNCDVVFYFLFWTFFCVVTAWSEKLLLRLWPLFHTHTHSRTNTRAPLQLGLQHAAAATAAVAAAAAEAAVSILHFLDFYIFFAPIFWLLFFTLTNTHAGTQPQRGGRILIRTHAHTARDTQIGTRAGVRGKQRRWGRFYSCAHSLRSNLLFLFSFSRFLMPPLFRCTLFYYCFCFCCCRPSSSSLIFVVAAAGAFLFAFLLRCPRLSQAAFVPYFVREWRLAFFSFYCFYFCYFSTFARRNDNNNTRFQEP